MTEAEAQTKRCFLTFATAHEGEASPTFPGHMVNKRHAGFQGVCIGSACMAWRHDYKATLIDKGTRRVRSAPEGSVYDPAKEELSAEVVGGFCGLAGKP